MSTADTRAFGAWLFFLADVLFFGALLFIYVFVRRGAPEWPDPAGVARVPSTLPLLAAASVVLAALLHRARMPLPLAFLAIAAALVLCTLSVRSAPSGGGRYLAVVFGFTVIWAIHLAGGLVAAGVQVLRGRDAASTPLLGRFLALQACFGVLIYLLVFLW